MAGVVGMGVEMPSRRAVEATVSRPTSSASLAATVFTERARAVSRLMGPWNPGSELAGDQPSRVTGSSTTSLSGVRPASSAASQTKGLKADPGWRRASVARL